jgi:hypothetical protein
MFNNIDAKRIPLYFIIFIIIITISTLSKKFSDSLDHQKNNDEYELIRKYLLNDSSFGDNKPKLWIHSKYVNHSGVWKPNNSSCQSELEHPYINLIVETIVEHNHNDFNICLIDDDSFSKLIPSWEHEISTLPDPHKTHCRELGMTTLLYIYGGIIVPNSFLCLNSLKPIYENGISNSKPFIAEFVNYKDTSFKNNQQLSFIPDTIFIGSEKENIVIKQLLEYHTDNVKNKHFSSEYEFKGKCSTWCLNLVFLNRINIINGKFIGTKTIQNKPVILDDLMEDKFLQIHKTCVGIFIPHDELMIRKKHRWLSLASPSDVINSKTVISKYLHSSSNSLHSSNINISPL